MRRQPNLDTVDLQEFKEIKNPLVARKVVLEQHIARLEQGEPYLLEPVKNWISQANQLEKWLSEGNWSEMKAFLQKVGLNRFFRSQTLTVTFKTPWISLAETNLAVRSTADISEQNLKWWCTLTHNRTVLEEKLTD